MGGLAPRHQPRQPQPRADGGAQGAVRGARRRGSADVHRERQRAAYDRREGSFAAHEAARGSSRRSVRRLGQSSAADIRRGGHDRGVAPVRARRVEDAGRLPGQEADRGQDESARGARHRAGPGAGRRKRRLPLLPERRAGRATLRRAAREGAGRRGDGSQLANGHEARRARGSGVTAPLQLGDDAPEGLVYTPELVSEEDERALLRELERLEFHAIRMHGVVARRTARHFGLDYDYERRGVIGDAEPMPEWLLAVRRHAAELAAVYPAELVEGLVQRYPEGAQIGWHRDAPQFGTVVGISLLAPCRMRFRRDAGGARRQHEVELEPRSGYVLAGPARTAW